MLNDQRGPSGFQLLGQTCRPAAKGGPRSQAAAEHRMQSRAQQQGAAPPLLASSPHAVPTGSFWPGPPACSWLGTLGICTNPHPCPLVLPSPWSCTSGSHHWASAPLGTAAAMGLPSHPLILLPILPGKQFSRDYFIK